MFVCVLMLFTIERSPVLAAVSSAVNTQKGRNHHVRLPGRARLPITDYCQVSLDKPVSTFSSYSEKILPLKLLTMSEVHTKCLLKMSKQSHNMKEDRVSFHFCLQGLFCVTFLKIHPLSGFVQSGYFLVAE